MKYNNLSPNIDERILDLSKDVRAKGIPTCLFDTLNQLVLTASIKNPKRILEIGTAVGISGSALLLSTNAELVTLEKDEESYNIAKETFLKFGVSDRVKSYLGDAGDIIKYLDPPFDFIFLDGAKSKYLEYMADLDRLLVKGGVLFCDNVLFRGYVDDGVKYGHSDETIVRNMRLFLDYMFENKNYISAIHRIGDGVLIAYKK